mmetsp:Transcript_18902/g.21324  ORF Transcript_18902/g.21324 Transcript_18902/m.21324 type:complete len:118 (+) Transcript_18902:463-816(+)
MGVLTNPLIPAIRFGLVVHCRSLECDFIDPDSTREFLLRCEASKYGGGFSKVPDSFPDPLHAHFSICGFSLIKEPGFLPLISVLGMTSRAFQESPFCDGKCANGNVYTPKRSLALEE